MSTEELKMLQQMLEYVEDYKRTLGRRFDAEKRHNAKCQIMAKYNNVENQIRYLCDHYGLKRQSQPYKIGLEELE